MSFTCPRCYGNIITYPRFADLCLHMEYDHGMWYLGKDSSSWVSRWQKHLQAEEHMLEEELRRTALKDDFHQRGFASANTFGSWDIQGSTPDIQDDMKDSVLDEQDQRNNIRLKHIEQILNQTKDELDQIKSKVVDRQTEVKTLRKQLVMNNKNTMTVQNRMQICMDELKNLRGELIVRDKELQIKTREADELCKFIQLLQRKEQKSKHELRVYLDKLFKRILNTESQLKLVERGITGCQSNAKNITTDTSGGTSYLYEEVGHASCTILPDSGFEDNVTRHSVSDHHRQEFKDHSKQTRKQHLCESTMRIAVQGAYERTMRLVFWYLEIDDLFKCRQVCKEWKKRAQRTEYWTKVILKNRRISSQFMQVISNFCSKTKYILLQGLMVSFSSHSASTSSGEEISSPESNAKGSLEFGLDCLLQSCNKHLLSLSIIDCSNLITDRCLWLAGAGCRCLQKMAYISDCYPASAESLWSLGAGCRSITTLIVPPLQPAISESGGCFNNRALLMIGKCWPELRVLCIGGISIDLDGLISVAVLCTSLQHLELDHLGEIRNATAEMMCETGLRNLEAIYFTHTPVSSKALVTFFKKCPELKMLMVQVSIEDYFANPIDSTNICEYNSRIAKLKALEKNSELNGILHCEAHPSV